MLAKMHKTDYELLPSDDCNKTIHTHSLKANNNNNKSLTKHYYTNALSPLERPDFSENVDVRI